MKDQDLVVYYLREDPSQWEKNSPKLISFRQLINIVPVIVLSDIEDQNSLAKIFQSGALGCIPTDNAAPELIIEIIGLICPRK